jgi:hypothetical protein
VLAIKNAIKDVFAPPDIDNGVKRVCEEAKYYSIVLTNIATAMRFQKEREKEEKEILEWICPKDRGYITPKRRDDVADTCQMLLNSKEYLRWVGQGPSTFICAGQRTLLSDSSNIMQPAPGSPISCSFLSSNPVLIVVL